MTRPGTRRFVATRRHWFKREGRICLSSCRLPSLYPRTRKKVLSMSTWLHRGLFGDTQQTRKCAFACFGRLQVSPLQCCVTGCHTVGGQNGPCGPCCPRLLVHRLVPLLPHTNGNILRKGHGQSSQQQGGSIYTMVNSRSDGESERASERASKHCSRLIGSSIRVIFSLAIASGAVVDSLCRCLVAHGAHASVWCVLGFRRKTWVNRE